MPGAADFLKGGGGSSSPSGGSGGAAEFLKTSGTKAKPKKKGNAVGEALGKSFGSLMSMISAPQQIVLHGVKGIGEAVTGDGKAALEELKQAGIAGAGINLPGAGQALQGKLGAKHISFTESLAPTGVKKLPYGLETLGGVATDPLTYLTVGVGPTAKAGLKTVEEVGGAALRSTVRQGGLKAVEKETQEAIRNRVLEKALDTVGEKRATKIADRQMSALEKRARGGVGFHVPGTSIDKHIIGSSEEGPLAFFASRSPKYRATRALFSPADLEDEARVAQNLRGKRPEDVEALAQKAGRLFNESGPGSRFNERMGKLAAEPLEEPGTFHKAWRRAAVSYPGTVLNRLRQAAFYGLAEGMRPDQWTRYMALGRKNYSAYTKLAAELGFESVDDAMRSPKFMSRLESALGTKGAKDEIAFRRFAEEPTYFSDIEERAPITRPGQILNKGRLLKRVTTKIRDTGTAVEESSRRANFLFNLEHRYGTYAEAGARTKRVLPGVQAVSDAERKIAQVLPFWTSMRADWQSVLRLMGENPGRVSALTRAATGIQGEKTLPGGGTLDLGQFTDRHMPSLELVKMLNIVPDLITKGPDEALVAINNMQGGPLVSLITSAHEAWVRDNRDQKDRPIREQWARFWREYVPVLQRIPSSAEKALAGKKLTSKDKSAYEALIRFATGVTVNTD